MRVEFRRGDGRELTRRERDAIQKIADDTAVEVRRLLPALPRPLVLGVETGTNVIEVMNNLQAQVKRVNEEVLGPRGGLHACELEEAELQRVHEVACERAQHDGVDALARAIERRHLEADRQHAFASRELRCDQRRATRRCSVGCRDDVDGDRRQR